MCFFPPPRADPHDCPSSHDTVSLSMGSSGDFDPAGLERWDKKAAKSIREPGTVVRTCRPSYLGGWDGRIA